MAATKTSCWDKECPGVPMAVNDAAARLSEGYFGRVHYVCDTCGVRWSITPADMLKHLPAIKQPVRRYGRR